MIEIQQVKFGKRLRRAAGDRWALFAKHPDSEDGESEGFSIRVINKASKLISRNLIVQMTAINDREILEYCWGKQ